MNYKHIFSFVLPALLLGSCGAESPFSQKDKEKGMCEFHKSALDLDIRTNDNVLMKSPTRADESGIVLNDFKINFINTDTQQTVMSVKYGEMSDVVLLEQGNYTVTATYGEDREAEWENPYFKGMSNEFAVNPNEITTDIGVISCKLQNVKVSIVFDPELKNAMGEDAYVEVKVSNGQSLKFSSGESRNGYFRLGAENTLVATFNGTIDGAKTSESKSLNNIESGNHYRITFKKHSHGNGSHGSATGDVTVNASVDVTNIDKNITVEEDKPLDDNERPNQGEPGTEPDDPPTPPTESGPQITALEPINLDIVNDVDAGSTVILNIKSNTGFTGFEVDVISETLNLGDVGLSNHLDLVNPGDALGALQGLGLLDDDNNPDVKLESLAGLKEKKFNITGFMPLLSPTFLGRHDFKLTVTDSEGTKVVVLQLNVK